MLPFTHCCRWVQRVKNNLACTPHSSSPYQGDCQQGYVEFNCWELWRYICSQLWHKITSSWDKHLSLHAWSYHYWYEISVLTWKPDHQSYHLNIITHIVAIFLYACRKYHHPLLSVLSASQITSRFRHFSLCA